MRMTRLPHAAALWAANLLVPGAGLVMLGRIWSGAAIGVLWGVALAATMLTGLVWREAGRTPVFIYFAASAAVLYCGAQVTMYMRKRALGNHLAGDARDTIFKAALAAYLAGRLDDSEKACKDLLAIDPDDVEATLQLATLARRRGDQAAARRHLVRTRYLDDDGRWDFEVGRELAALAESAEPTVRMVTLTPREAPQE
jgi:hypothetical protein